MMWSREGVKSAESRSLPLTGNFVAQYDTASSTVCPAAEGFLRELSYFFGFLGQGSYVSFNSRFVGGHSCLAMLVFYLFTYAEHAKQIRLRVFD